MCVNVVKRLASLLSKYGTCIRATKKVPQFRIFTKFVYFGGTLTKIH